MKQILYNKSAQLDKKQKSMCLSVDNLSEEKLYDNAYSRFIIRIFSYINTIEKGSGFVWCMRKK